MILWSILTQQAWKELQRKGRLHANRRHVTKDYLDPYLWMAEQMQRRLKAPKPSKDAMPIWAWHRWQGKRCKPDLRACNHLPKGERGIRLELQVADDRVLLSDFDLWHYVLNYWYLPETEDAGEAFEKKLALAGLSFYKCDHEHPLSHPQYRREIEKSWERIFDVGWADREHTIAEPSKKKSIQATLWEIRLTDVVDAWKFTAR
jgi:hypothetical protein